MTDPKKLYLNVSMSLIKWLRGWMTSEGLALGTYFDWDAHAQEAELPGTDTLVGPSGCGMTEDTPGVHQVVFSFGISTYQDLNLFNMRRLISSLYGSLEIGQRLPIYDADSAAPVSWMVIASPRALTPMSKAEIRSLQFVELTALIDPGVTSSLR